MRNSIITVTDMFCGAGGSSSGAVQAHPHVEIRYAINHWERAIITHNTNFPQTEHVLTDINETVPERYGPTTILIASPECVNHSLSKGRKRKLLAQMQLPFDGQTVSQILDEEERSRCTMADPQKWARVHKYEYILLENVVDVRFWSEYENWRNAWGNLDKNLTYDYQELYLNSMFFWPTPQRRDRWYFVAWRRGNKAPDLTFTPLAYCPFCQKQVYAVQSWKNSLKRWGRYGKHGQYVYNCPACNREAAPYYMPAATAIDWSQPITRIGDRREPLASKTIARIEHGLQRFAQEQPFPIQINKTSFREFPIREALPTQIGGNGQVLINPFLLPLSSQVSNESRVSSLAQPSPSYSAQAILPSLMNLNHSNVPASAAPTQMPFEGTEAVIPWPFIVDLIREYRPRNILDPVSTIVGGGEHQSLVVPPRPFIAELHGTASSCAIADPLLAVCAGGLHHDLVVPPDSDIDGRYAWLLPYYSNGKLTSALCATPSVTTRDRCALVTTPSPKNTVQVEDCGFRMLQLHEIKAAMAFLSSYVVTGNRREQVKQLGNATTPPLICWLMSRILGALAS